MESTPGVVAEAKDRATIWPMRWPIRVWLYGREWTLGWMRLLNVQFAVRPGWVVDIPFSDN